MVRKKAKKIEIKNEMENESKVVTAKQLSGFIHRYLISKLIRKFMTKGLKLKMQNLFYSMLLKLQLLLKLNPFYVLYRALKNLNPLTQILYIGRKRRKRELPVILTKRRRLYLTLTWFLQAIRQNKSGLMFNDKFIFELLNLVFLKGYAVTKKYGVLAAIIKKRQLKHYRWKKK